MLYPTSVSVANAHNTTAVECYKSTVVSGPLGWILRPNPAYETMGICHFGWRGLFLLHQLAHELYCQLEGEPRRCPAQFPALAPPNLIVTVQKVSHLLCTRIVFDPVSIQPLPLPLPRAPPLPAPRPLSPLPPWSPLDTAPPLPRLEGWFCC